MNVVGPALRTIFMADNAITEKIDSRAYPQKRPQELSAFPAITWERVSSEHMQTHDGKVGFARCIVMVSVWGNTTKESVDDLANDVRKALHCYSGENIHWITVTNVSDTYLPIEGSDDGYYLVSITIDVKYKEDD